MPTRPAGRESTPGIPLRAATSIPESSASVGNPVAANPSRALAMALSANVAPVSGARHRGDVVESQQAQPGDTGGIEHPVKFGQLLTVAACDEQTSTAEGLLRRRPSGSSPG